jgi:hypothetical protein
MKTIDFKCEFGLSDPLLLILALGKGDAKWLCTAQLLTGF